MCALHFAVEVAKLSRGEALGAPDWPWAAYPARGDDEWCVVSIRDTRDWLALCDLIGFAEGRKLNTPKKRLAARTEIDAALGAWVAARDPLDVAEKCQAAGVPAAPMLRLADLPDFPYFRARDFYRVEDHPHLMEPVIAERSHTRSAILADPETKPAPLMGEQSAAVMADWLGFSSAQCAALIERGVLEPVEASVLDAARVAKAS